MAAAVEMQRSLAAHRWPAMVDVRVRAGIHSGRPTLTDAGYIGLPVHTAARVCAVAHGGQIVVTEEARAAVDRSAPVGLRFRSLGEHRLRGLADPKGLFQVEADGLATDFPPPSGG